jgi:hypothetical protein
MLSKSLRKTVPLSVLSEGDGVSNLFDLKGIVAIDNVMGP